MAHDRTPTHDRISTHLDQLSEAKRQRAFSLAYLNGTLWALGNGLSSTALIIYLVRQLGAAGLGIGVVLAAPHIAGVLRLMAPALMRRVNSRREFCLLCYGGSALLLAVISQLADPDRFSSSEPGRFSSSEIALPLVVAFWCVYHLLEYLGTVALWSWLGDLAPQDIRGRFIGVRERCMLFARIAGMLLAGAFSWMWTLYAANQDEWVGYAIPACAAASLMMAAILPLMRMPDPRSADGKAERSTTGFLRPLTDPRMRWLLAFGIWFSLANGLTQSAQYWFPIAAFGLPLLARNIFTSGMRLGQAALAPRVGACADALGNRRVLIIAQLIVASGPLFFIWAAHMPHGSNSTLFTLPITWWILTGAWAAWIAYVGLNVGLPNLMLKLADSDEKATYLAWYFAVTGVVYGVCTIAGGALYDWLDSNEPTWSLMSWTFDHNDVVFGGGFVLRVLAVVWLLPLREEIADT